MEDDTSYETQKRKHAIEQLKQIAKYRETHSAPVDTQGCDVVGDTSDPKTYRFQTLIALMLSSQTKDPITSKAVERLRTLPGGLTAKSLAEADVSLVESLIRPVSFAPTKSTNIVAAAKFCVTTHDGDIPNTMEGLMSIRGVGVKMATLAMNACWGSNSGIGVDTHVHRIANRLKWVSTQTPEKTEIALQEMFPSDLWDTINTNLVGFGQTVCSARAPKCKECPVKCTCPSIE